MRTNTALTLALASLVCLGAPMLTANVFAQQSQAMVKTTSGGKLDVKVEPTVTDNTNYTFKVSFLQRNSQTVQVHIDYDLTISKNGVQIFSAAKSTNQQVLHTAEGVVTIPYNFNSTGNYTVTVTVYGVVFVPINPENAQFNITVVPEFPSGVMVAAAGLVAFAVIASRKLRQAAG